MQTLSAQAEVYSHRRRIESIRRGFNGEQTGYLSESAVKAMQSHEYRKGIWVSDEQNTINYGLGWDSVDLAPFSDYGVTALAKGGDTMLYHAVLITIPEHDISMAVLSSGGSSIYNQMFASKVLLEVLADQGIIDNVKPDQTFSSPDKVKMPTELSAYSGLYGTVGETLDITIKDGEMQLPALLGELFQSRNMCTQATNILQVRMAV